MSSSFRVHPNGEKVRFSVRSCRSEWKTGMGFDFVSITRLGLQFIISFLI
jgi:hypothetical protein